MAGHVDPHPAGLQCVAGRDHSALFRPALRIELFCSRGDLVNGHIVGRGDGSPLLWLHLFWFFGHPEVYIAVLPGMGLATSLFANFARRRVAGYRVMAAMLVAIGLLGLVVWGHHMFVSGMNPYAGTAFALTTMAIAVPSTVEVLGWLTMLWGGSLRLRTPMLFALGFLSFFIAGGLTGPDPGPTGARCLSAQHVLRSRALSPRDGHGWSLLDFRRHLLLVSPDDRSPDE